MTDDRHIGCAIALAIAANVFIERAVQNPVQLVFDTPMSANGLPQPLTIGRVDAADKVTRFFRDF